MNKNGSRTPARLPPKTPSRSRPTSDRVVERDAVQVFCRLRPMQSDADLSCFRVASPSTVALTPPESAINFKSSALKETQYGFKHVFDAASTQRACYQVVAQPLVENLLRGKNGLLFTYGVTGSGKTYTMTGNAQDQGIMPRCLDVLFKTIADYQTKKYVFKPDRLNGFEILCEADAMLERQADMLARFTRQTGAAAAAATGAQTPHRKYSDGSEVASRASCDASTVDGLDEDNMYAVFISYVEVYNNSVYDLLEEGGAQLSLQQQQRAANAGTGTGTLQSKIIREDSSKTMYVHGVQEVEVKTVQEAIETFQRGQKRKRVGHTLLNAESSRSHSVFTIRLVQAPTDGQGESVMMDRRTVTVSQLSLVDLAGSERTNRTKNTGARLREAGNINNSLMSLRTCLEVLRENQTAGMMVRKVPYRDAKITHLFKSYFDGEGVVRMVVCINPRAEDYDESVQVMKFAEMTQDVQIARPTPIKHDIGLTPGRRKANQLFRIAVNNLEEMGVAEARRLPVDISLVYSLGPCFPDHRLHSPESEQIIGQLMQHLEQRIHKRKVLLGDFDARQSNFRMTLHDLEREIIALRTENASLKAAFGQERQRTQSHENKIVVHESAIDQLNKKLKNRDNEIRNLQTQLNQKQQLLNQKELEKEKQKKRLNCKFAVEREKIESELETKLQQQKNEMHDKMRDKENKLQRLADIFNSNEAASEMPALSLPPLLPERQTPRTVSELQSLYHTPSRATAPISAARGVPVANIRHRRSRSTGERWLEHRAPNPVPLGTILQPYYRNRKSVTKLTDARDITNPKTTKYCLVSQAADTDGEVETRLFKGNVIPTTGGGAQVVFDDVECLKQSSPSKGGPALPHRKRPSHPPSQQQSHTVQTTTHYGSASASGAGSSSSGGLLNSGEVAAKCSIGIEGHTNTKKSKY